MKRSNNHKKMDLPTEKDLKKRNKKDKTDLDKEKEELYDYDEDSDIPVTEKKTKQGKIRK